MTGRSTLWILLGCLAMAAVVAATFAFGVPINTIFLVGLALVCPLAHLWMMRSSAHDLDHRPSSHPASLEDS